MTSAQARVQHCYSNNEWHFHRFAFGNLLPEVDQFMLGFKLVPLIDRYFTYSQAAQLSTLTSSIYDELEADPEFHALGSAMPHAYAEIWRQDFKVGHYYLYVPSTIDRAKPHPALVFLHGSGGNFKAYVWLLAKVADATGTILIAPSYGMGEWHLPDSQQVVDQALAHARHVVALDDRQIHLAGLSNGGLGAAQCGTMMGNKLKSVIFLSPVFDSFVLSRNEARYQWQSQNVLIMTGREDDRVPVDYVATKAHQLESFGAHVSFSAIDNANHFMLFSDAKKVLAEIEQWLQKHSTTEHGQR